MQGVLKSVPSDILFLIFCQEQISFTKTLGILSLLLLMY